MSAGLYEPTREEFAALAAGHDLVPVWREVLADLQTPLAVYERLRRAPGGAEGPTFLLESVEHGERWGRYSFIGLRPLLGVTARRGRVDVTGPAPDTVVTAALGGDPFATLSALTSSVRTPRLPGLPPLYAGVVGYLGWDVVRFIEAIPDTGVDDLGLDDARVVLPGQLVAFDHLRQRLFVVSNVLVDRDVSLDAQYDAAVEASEQLVSRLGEPVHAPPLAPPRAETVTDAAANMSRDGFLGAVERVKSYIRDGDAFQVVPSQRFALETRAEAFDVYRVLRVINPSPYMYLFDWPDVQVVGSSPEALVTVQGRRATIQPIAGSRPRSADLAEDAALESAMLADAKERAEHVMLVDLARNDLGRVCDIGTVEVTDLMGVVRYSHIMHMRSTVTGRVREGIDAVGVLRATFPAGTLSGAPKVRAMEIIDELEPTRRGLYGGGIGYIDLAGNMDLCIAIRTVVLAGGRAYVQAGAGVVADSVPQREFEETQSKAMALLAAVRAAERMAARGVPG